MVKTKMPQKILFFFSFLIGLLYCEPLNSVSAASGRFYMRPTSVSATVGEEFEIDVMLDSGNNDLTEAVFTISYNPNYLELTKVQYGNLFDQYPESLYSVDTVNGEVSLGGFSQDDYYNSEGISGLFGKVIFLVKNSGATSLNFVYDGTDDSGQTYIKEPGSPSSLIDLESPESVDVNLYSASVSTTTGKDGTTDSLPETADGRLSSVGIFLGAFLTVVGLLFFYLDINPFSTLHSFLSKRGRVIVVKD